MKRRTPFQLVLKYQHGQSMVEYMLLLAVVMAIVLVGLKTFSPRIYSAGNVYFNRAGLGIVGNGTRCGDGVCDDLEDLQGVCCSCDCLHHCGAGTTC